MRPAAFGSVRPRSRGSGRRVGCGGGLVEQAEREQQVLAADPVRLMWLVIGSSDVRVEFEAAVFAVFRVVLDQEPAAVGVELRDELDHDAGHGEHAGGGVDVGGAEFDEFAPAQPGLDVGLHQQPRGVVRECA